MRSFIFGALSAAIFSLPWIAVSYVGLSWVGLPFTPFGLFDWLVRLMPGQIVTWALETMVGGLQALSLGSTSATGKTFEASLALVLAFLALAVLGGIQALAGRRTQASWIWSGGIAGVLLWAAAVYLADFAGWGELDAAAGIAWLGAVSLGWGFATSWSGTRLLLLSEMPETQPRRRFIRDLGLISLLITGLAVGLGRWLWRRQKGLEPVAEPFLERIQQSIEPTPSGILPAEGIREEVTPIQDFYRVDINVLPPSQGQVSAESAGGLAEVLRAQGDTEMDIRTEGYLLVVDGLVDRPLILTLDQLKELPQVSQYATLECISNRVGGDLIGTTKFTGVPLREVLAEAGLSPEAVDVKFTCADGYTESLPIQSALDTRTLLCYAMGEQMLSSAHGAPLRLFTPDRFGQKNPKWIVRIEAVNEDYQGYWPQRGWSEQAWVQTTAVIDTATSRSAGTVECGGIAFSGARGIQAVEVQVDDGEWLPAELKPPLSPLSWVLWQLTLLATQGQHELTVRTVDGTGELQTAESSPTQPDGATGYHSRTVNVL